MKHAFIDEAGNKDLDVPKPGATNFYVLGCVLVDEVKQAELEAAAEALATRMFSGGAMKSSSIGGDDVRRIAVLEAVASMPASFYALAIDKRKVDKESGLRFGRSFYKFVLRHAGGELLRSFAALQVTIDNHGSEDFRAGVLDYMQRHYSGQLFASSHLKFALSSSSRGVQLADLIAGSVRIAVEDDRADLLAPIREKLFFNGAWPRDEFPFHLDRDTTRAEERFDRRIIELVLQRTQAFLEGLRETRSEVELAQSFCVRHLLEHYRQQPKNYVYGRTLLRHLGTHLPGIIKSSRLLMSNVVAPARDKGVLIVAGRRGYKLPTCMAEVLRHADQTCHKVQPMLRRMLQLRQDIRLATGGEEDLFRRPEFAFLQLFEELPGSAPRAL